MSYAVGDRVKVVSINLGLHGNASHSHTGESGSVSFISDSHPYPIRVHLDGTEDFDSFPFSNDELEFERQDGFRIGTKVVVKTGTRGVHPKFNRNILSIQGLWHGAALVSNPEDDETATILLQDLAITEATR